MLQNVLAVLALPFVIPLWVLYKLEGWATRRRWYKRHYVSLPLPPLRKRPQHLHVVPSEDRRDAS